MARKLLGLLKNTNRKLVYYIAVLVLFLPIVFWVLVYCFKHDSSNDLIFVPLEDKASKKTRFDDNIIEARNDDMTCYGKTNKTLTDILTLDLMKPRSIFFIDTSCTSYKLGRIVIKRRAACAVESAARAHPKRKIYLLYASPGIIRNYGTESDRLLASLKGYKNVNILYLNIKDLVKGSPLEAYYRFLRKNRTGKIYPDIKQALRLLILWKFAGIYVDFDVMVLKPFSTLNHNFIIVDKGTIDNAIVSMSDDIGHNFVNVVMNQYRNKYDVQLSEYNQGNEMVSVISKKCRKEIVRMVSESCHGVFVYSSKHFFPISSGKWRTYFEEDKRGKVLKSLRQNYTICLWDEFSGRERIMLNSTAPYLRLAKQYCPQVVRQLHYYF